MDMRSERLLLNITFDRVVYGNIQCILNAAYCVVKTDGAIYSQVH